MAGPATEQDRLRAMFTAIPRVDAVARPAPRRLPGLAGWTPRRWAVLAGAAVALFWLYGGAAAWGAGATADALVLLAGAGLGAFVAATYVPAQGARADLSPCAVLPLLWVVAFAPWALSAPGATMNALVTVALTAVFAVQRAAGVGCRV